MKKILQVKDLCKTYIISKRQHHVLKNVNMHINEGEFVAIMGPSGSGKSTLLYNISGIDQVTSGSVLLDGREINKLSEKEMSYYRLKKMGFIFQQMNLLKNLEILDNIIAPAYMLKERPRKDINKDALTLMKRVGIIELGDNDITQASGGQLQRAAICRALINRPKIIFGDEPTGSLNSKASSEIMDIFQEINSEGTTIMLVTHDVKVASKTERVLFMIDGKIEGEYTLGKFHQNVDYKAREEKLSNWLFRMGW